MKSEIQSNFKAYIFTHRNKFEVDLVTDLDIFVPSVASVNLTYDYAKSIAINYPTLMEEEIIEYCLETLGDTII